MPTDEFILLHSYLEGFTESEPVTGKSEKELLQMFGEWLLERVKTAK